MNTYYTLIMYIKIHIHILIILCNSLFIPFLHVLLPVIRLSDASFLLDLLLRFCSMLIIGNT